MDTIALTQSKGGSAKTTTTHNLCGSFALRGLRVLAVDNDPQASLTQGFIGPEAAGRVAESRTMAAVYGGDASPGCVIRGVVPGVDLIPGSPTTDAHNAPSPWECPRLHQFALRDFLAELAPGYDVCLVDTPPNLHLCCWASLAAAGYALIPVAPEDYGAQGLAVVRGSIAAAAARVNPRLRLLGYVLSMVRRLSVHKLFEERLRAGYGGDVFAATVPSSADVLEALIHRKPVTHHRPRSAATAAFNALADEVLARVEAAKAAGVAA